MHRVCIKERGGYHMDTENNSTTEGTLLLVVVIILASRNNNIQLQYILATRVVCILPNRRIISIVALCSILYYSREIDT